MVKRKTTIYFPKPPKRKYEKQHTAKDVTDTHTKKRKEQN